MSGTWLDQPLSTNVLERWSGRVASRTNSIHASLIRACREVMRLRARVAELEAAAQQASGLPPALPPGYSIVRLGDRWDWAKSGSIPVQVPAEVYRALAWAIDHASPPAGDDA